MGPPGVSENSEALSIGGPLTAHSIGKLLV